MIVCTASIIQFGTAKLAVREVCRQFTGLAGFSWQSLIASKWQQPASWIWIHEFLDSWVQDLSTRPAPEEPGGGFHRIAILHYFKLLCSILPWRRIRRWSEQKNPGKNHSKNSWTVKSFAVSFVVKNFSEWENRKQRDQRVQLEGALFFAEDGEVR